MTINNNIEHLIDLAIFHLGHENKVTILIATKAEEGASYKELEEIFVRATASKEEIIEEKILVAYERFTQSHSDQEMTFWLDTLGELYTALDELRKFN